MSKQSAPKTSAFKALYTDMVNNGGNWENVNAKFKKPLKVFVKESFPFFMVSDGFFYVPAYFTQEALNKFYKENANQKFLDLVDSVIQLNDWSLETHKVNSAINFTSYGHLEIRLVVKGFTLRVAEKFEPQRTPINLFRDDEMKTCIQHFRHSCLEKAASKLKHQAAPTSCGPSKGFKKGQMAGSIVALSGAKEFSDFPFKEKNTASIKMQEIFMNEKKEEALIAYQDVKADEESKQKPSKKKDGKKSEELNETHLIRMAIKRIIKYTPSKESMASKGGKRPQSASKGKSTGKKSGTTSTVSKKDSEKTIGEFKKYLDWFTNKDRKGGLLGKRPASGDKPSAKRTK